MTEAIVRQALFGDATVYDMEYRVRHRSGRWVWLRERARVVRRDADGKARHLMGTIEDIGELKAAQEAVQASEAHYRILAENASSIVSLADSEGRLLWVSPSVKSLLDWEPDDLIGIDVVTILHPDDLPVVRQAQQGVHSGHEVSVEVRARTPSNIYRWFEVLLRPTFDDDGIVTGRVAGWRDIDTEYRTRQELARSREDLRVLASHDALTGLYNRRAFTNVCETHLAEARQATGLQFVDVDHFKAVNDTFGHVVGDAVLKTIAKRIVACRDDLTVGRFGGDEFLILLPQASDQSSLVRAAQALYESKRAGRARWAIAGAESSAAR